MSLRAAAIGLLCLVMACEAEPAKKPARASSSAAAVASASAPSPFGERRPLRSARPRKKDASAPAASAPVLHGPDGAVLGQTDDRPQNQSKLLQERGALLFRAIVQNDPALARPTFFPLLAYEQVKASPNPKRDFERRLLENFARDIERHHRRLGDEPGRARFIDLWVPEDGARWMKPGSEGNKLGYWRVLRSRLRYADAEGKQQSLEITSMISWRGEWYVVHVDGFE